MADVGDGTTCCHWYVSLCSGCNQGRLRYRQSQPHITQTQQATVDSDIPLADLGPRWPTRSHSIAIILYMLNFQRRTMRYLHIVCFSRGQVVVCDVLRLVLGP